jgi:hypothetical protein
MAAGLSPNISERSLSTKYPDMVTTDPNRPGYCIAMFIAPYPPIENPATTRSAAGRRCVPSTVATSDEATRLITMSDPPEEFAHSVSEWCSPFPSGHATTTDG